MSFYLYFLGCSNENLQSGNDNISLEDYITKEKPNVLKLSKQIEHPSKYDIPDEELNSLIKKCAKPHDVICDKDETLDIPHTLATEYFKIEQKLKKL